MSPLQGHIQGVPSVPLLPRILPCQASRWGSMHERAGLNQTGDTPHSPLFRHWASRSGRKEGTGCEQESMLWGLNPNFPQTCRVTSGRSLHISEPQLLPLEHPLPYKLSSQVALVAKNPPANAVDLRLPCVGKIPWRRAWPPTPVFLPGESPWSEEPGGLQTRGSQQRQTPLK